MAQWLFPLIPPRSPFRFVPHQGVKLVPAVILGSKSAGGKNWLSTSISAVGLVNGEA